MITEDYVSFETAKLLKEKGFGGERLSMYLTPKPHSGMGNPNEAKIAPHGRDSHYYEGYLYQCEAPTLQMAMKWLRERHKIFFRVNYYGLELGSDWAQLAVMLLYKNGCEIAFEGFDLEELYEKAIRYCLENLI